jgi:hypothetical protein
MKSKRIFLGMDDSNHGHKKSRIGELIVAAYSRDNFYWNKIKKKRKEFFNVDEKLENGLNYFFTMIPQELAISNYSNLHFLAPIFVKKILFFERENINLVKIGLDGNLRKNHSLKLRDLLKKETGIPISIKNFVKKNRVHDCPYIVYSAHVIANGLYREPFLNLEDNFHYMPFSAKSFSKNLKYFKN